MIGPFPSEIWVNVLKYADISSVKAASRSCRALYHVCNLESLWAVWALRDFEQLKAKFPDKAQIPDPASFDGSKPENWMKATKYGISPLGWKATYQTYHSSETEYAESQRAHGLQARKDALKESTSLGIMTTIPLGGCLLSVIMIILSFQFGGGFSAGHLGFVYSFVPFSVTLVSMAIAWVKIYRNIAMFGGLIYTAFWILPALYADGSITCSYFVVMIPYWIVLGPMALGGLVPFAQVPLFFHDLCHGLGRKELERHLVLLVVTVDCMATFLWLLLVCLRHDESISWPWLWVFAPVWLGCAVTLLASVLAPCVTRTEDPIWMAVAAFFYLVPIAAFSILLGLRYDETITTSYWIVFLPLLVMLGLSLLLALLIFPFICCDAQAEAQRKATARPAEFWRILKERLKKSAPPGAVTPTPGDETADAAPV
ncbi:hypothetical protein PAPYR_3107 [Paratrimastix pyriformis]|uniref:F-box domain-containing protein n=1 Tax=Paratrimastix pyriformis TaxID=342808 RepID=A0ABQ8UNU6_9EUKA|nr:hypothetical protein PAPYR_3107 [Paratrimastix pyriformis]